MTTKTLQTPNKETAVKVGSLQEAKEKVYSEIQNGTNYREIAKTKFDVDGTVRSFNISQISQIKSEFEPKNAKIHTNEAKAEAFRLFRNGYNPADVLIETKYSFEFVKQAWQEYLEFKDKVAVDNSFIRNLTRELLPIKNCKTFNDIRFAVGKAVIGYLDMKDQVFSCCVCGKNAPIFGKMLEDAKKYLSRNWGHGECIEEENRQRNHYRW